MKKDYVHLSLNYTKIDETFLLAGKDSSGYDESNPYNIPGNICSRRGRVYTKTATL